MGSAKLLQTANDPREAVERANCPACRERRLHTAEEWKNHPVAGHGYDKQNGWTHPLLLRSLAEAARKTFVDQISHVAFIES